MIAPHHEAPHQDDESTDRNAPIWPFPGQPQRPWWECSPPHNLPPPRFAVGDRVETRWGAATVLRVYDHEHFDGRAYHLRFDFSSAPEGFGKTWSEADMQPLVERARKEEAEETELVMPAPRKAAPQLELF